jgi:two-component system, sensor histidine kinase LadS
MLLLGIRAALAWTVACALVVTAFVIAHACGHHFPRTYPPEWETIIDAAGYIGLAPFLAFLGSIFERTRAQAQDQLRAALEKLSLANERLERLNRDKDEFMNIAAHDLRNPLGGIIGFAGVLKLPGEPNAALVKQAGETIESLGVRMNGILSNLLDIRRIEEGKLNLKPERCTYQAIVSEVVLSFRQQAEAKRITVLSELPGDAPAFVGDRNVTAQIFENLLSNAIKYSPAGSTVRCTVDLCGEHVKLNVVDNGPGLSENDQRNLFKKFAKLAPRPTAGENSNGLGLWIVQKMAQAMNGNVTCFSKQGSGSTFSLHLPLAA